MRNFKIFILILVMSLGVTHAQEILTNGTFEDSTDWETEQYGGSGFTWTIEDGVSQIIIDSLGENTYDMQLKQIITIETGWPYDISFDIYSSGEDSIGVWIQENHADWATFDNQSIFVTNEWQTVSYTTAEMEVDDADAKLTFVFRIVEPGDTIKIDNVSMSYEGTLVSLNDFSTIQPSGFSLYQNYPNPFNPITTIAYSVEQSGLVNLEIYNMLGEKVETLVNEIKQAGQYETVWDASTFTSGTYIYRFKVDNKIRAEKMILTK